MLQGVGEQDMTFTQEIFEGLKFHHEKLLSWHVLSCQQFFAKSKALNSVH